MQIEESRLDWLQALELSHGSHQETEKATCVMEAVAYVAGEPWSDHPKCACPVVTRFAMRLNDRWDEKRRQQLKPYVIRIVGTRSTPAVERKRAFMCADFACRELLPMLMEHIKRPEWAVKLRALPDVVDKKAAEQARDLAREARAYAAAAAAYADAAADAAYAAYAADAAAADVPSIKEKFDSMALGLLARLIEVKP